MRHVLRSMVILMLGIGASFACSGASAGELDGRWRCGKWTDENTGHEGPLRGRFRQIDDCHYRVVFTGKFAKVVPFVFVTKMNIVGREGDKVILAGESRVPGMGKFTYNAVADEHHFHSQYSSRRWSGEFDLSR